MPSRRQLLAVFGSGTAVGLPGCLDEIGVSESDFSPGTDEDADWPMARYDSTNTAYSPDAAAPRDGVRERWTYEGGMVTGPPAVADGTVFLPTSDGLVALDSTSGEEVWRYAPDEGRWAAPPAVHDGTVYAGERAKSGVRALEADTGEEIWSNPNAGDSRAGVHLLAGEHVSEPVLDAGSRDGEVFRLDAATGERTWTTDLFGEISAFGFRFGALYVGTYGASCTPSTTAWTSRAKAGGGRSALRSRASFPTKKGCSSPRSEAPSGVWGRALTLGRLDGAWTRSSRAQLQSQPVELLRRGLRRLRPHPRERR